MAKTAYIRIRGKRWRVVFQNGGDTKSYGWCDYDTRTITIRYSPQERETLIHEIIHACQPDLTEEAVIEIENAIVHALNKFYPRRDV